jgi:DNA repair ATPase RecN
MKKSLHYLSLLLLSFLLTPILASANEVSESYATSSSATSTIALTKSQVFTACSQDAIELRDTKLAQARGSYNNAMNALLVERKEAEKEAVAIEDEKEKKDAIKESVDSYKVQVKVIQNTLTQSRKTIWQNFENDTKTCRDNLEKKDDDENKTSKKAPKEVSEVSKVAEQKSVKESLFDSLKSLFSKE